MRLITILWVAVLSVQSVFAQVSYSELPKNKQLFPRNASDSAEVKLSGLVIQQGVQAAIYKLFRNGNLIDSCSTSLTYQNSVAAFSKNFMIKAEKAEYKIHFSLYDGSTENCVLAVDSLVAGDVFIVNGQSNAASPNQGPGGIVSSEWIRTFGSSAFTEVDCAKDTLWGLGLGTTTQSNFAIGVWSMKLAKMLSDSLQIPVCIINGSRFGSIISSHLPNASNHVDLKTIYGRLLFRAQKAGVTNNVKAFFWYQGESNGDTSNQFYSNRFDQLYNFWKSDFPGLNRLFVMQTRPGCIVGANFQYHQQLRETLRNLENQYSDITLMSTTGIPNFDGCHFLSSGYNVLATQLYYQVLRDVYFQNVPVNIDPAKILSASFVNNANTLLALKMSQPLIWPGLYNGNNLKDYFYFDTPGINVLSGWTSEDTVYLQLSASSLTNKVSYLPNIYYNGSTTLIYQGPWLLNNRGVGAFTFKDFSLTHQLQISAQSATVLCHGDSVLLSANKTGLNFQWFSDGNLLANTNTESIWVKNSGLFSLQMSDGFGNVIQSNIIQVVSGQSPIEISASSTSICDGEVATLNVNTNASVLWSTGSNAQTLAVSISGLYTVTAVDSIGCVSEDSIQINVNPLPIANLLHQTLTICNGDSTRLYLENNEIGLWSNLVTDSVIYVKTPGYYAASVTNAYGCVKSSDTVFVDVINSMVTIVPSGPLSICANQKIVLNGGSPGFTAYQWMNNGINIPNANAATFKPLTSGNYSVSIIDSFGCNAVSNATMLTINKSPSSTFTLTNQFDTCNDSLVTLTASGGVGMMYQWYRNGIIIPGRTKKIFNTTQAGNYSVVLTNPWGCTKLSTLTTIPVLNPTATIQVNGSLAICTGDSVKLSANIGIGYTYQWKRNNANIAGATNDFFYAKKKGTYKVIITNASGCSATSAQKYVVEGNCNISTRASGELSNWEGEDDVLNLVEVYPNPFTSYLNIELDQHQERIQFNWTLIDVTGRKCMQGQSNPNQLTTVLNDFNIHSGLYFLVLETSSSRRIIKVQKTE